MAFAIEHKETKRHLKKTSGIYWAATCASKPEYQMPDEEMPDMFGYNHGFFYCTCNGIGHIWSRRNGAEQVLAILEKNQPGQWEIVTA